MHSLVGLEHVPSHPYNTPAQMAAEILKCLNKIVTFSNCPATSGEASVLAFDTK